MSQRASYSESDVVVHEVFYKRTAYITGGGDCCLRRRSKSDVSLVPPSASSESRVSDRSSCCTPTGQRLLVPPPNTPYASPQGARSPEGPANSTSHLSQMLLGVPKMGTRSKSSESLGDSRHRSGSRSRWNVGGLEEMAAGSKSGSSLRK